MTFKKSMGDIEIRTYDEAGYVEYSEYVRVFKKDRKFFVFIGEDGIDRHEIYVYEKHIPNKNSSR